MKEHGSKEIVYARAHSWRQDAYQNKSQAEDEVSERFASLIALRREASYGHHAT